VFSAFAAPAAGRDSAVNKTDFHEVSIASASLCIMQSHRQLSLDIVVQLYRSSVLQLYVLSAICQLAISTFLVNFALFVCL